MKGRCIRVSLYRIYALSSKKYKVKKSLPESLTGMEIPQCACKKGSFTIEAAILLPLLVCFFSFLLFYFQIMQIQLSVQSVLEKNGRNLAFLASLEEQKDTENTWNTVYVLPAKAAVVMELRKNKKIEGYVRGGALGISLLKSKTEGDVIRLEADYSIKFPIDLFGKKYFRISQNACFRKWTGWHAVNSEDAEEIWVYLTPNGVVYHQRKSCPYLSLSIQRVLFEEIPFLRNKSGSLYKECTGCKKTEMTSGMVYITDYGTYYHFESNCSSLKRTIIQKRLSEVEGMKSCMKCSK